jgi:hypothetical protein
MYTTYSENTIQLKTLFADHVYFYQKSVCLNQLHIALVWKQNLFQVEYY